MRIFSKFHDYYDIGLAYGQDEKLIYERKRIELTKKIPQLKTSYYELDDVDLFHKFKEVNRRYIYYIGFCGEIYRFLETTFQDINKPFERQWQRINGDFAPIFLELNCPVFSYGCVGRVEDYNSIKRETNLIVNPCLAKYNFYKIYDAFTTYQKIAQYLSNELAQEKEFAAPTDKDLIAAHGFDKNSFRRENPPNRKIKKL